VQNLNVTGRDQGFKLLGLFSIVPASRVKAVTRMYQHARIQPGSPLAPANIFVEQIESFYILFSIPHIYVRADFVVFENTAPSKPHRSADGAALRMKTPKTKLQTPKKLQIPSSNMAVSRRSLGFAAWDFFGAWCLGFGIWPVTDKGPLTADH